MSHVKADYEHRNSVLGRALTSHEMRSQDDGDDLECSWRKEAARRAERRHNGCLWPSRPGDNARSRKVEGIMQRPPSYCRRSCVVGAATPVFAHHSFNMFDVRPEAGDHPRGRRQTVGIYELRPWLTITVTNPDRTETDGPRGAPAQLVPKGITVKTCQSGREGQGWQQARSRGRKGGVLLKFVQHADGTFTLPNDAGNIGQEALGPVESQESKKRSELRARQGSGARGDVPHGGGEESNRVPRPARGFSMRVLASGLEGPWESPGGPDQQLWVI